MVVPADVAERINHPMVLAGHSDYQTIKDLSEENFDQFLNSSYEYYLEVSAAGGGAVSLGIHLLPFLIAYKNAKISQNVEIGPYCIIGPEVEIGTNTLLHSHVNIIGNTKIGNDNEIYSFSSIGTPPQDLKYKGEKNSLIIGCLKLIILITKKI